MFSSFCAPEGTPDMPVNFEACLEQQPTSSEECEEAATESVDGPAIPEIHQVELVNQTVHALCWVASPVSPPLPMLLPADATDQTEPALTGAGFFAREQASAQLTAEGQGNERLPRAEGLETEVCAVEVHVSTGYLDKPDQRTKPVPDEVFQSFAPQAASPENSDLQLSNESISENANIAFRSGVETADAQLVHKPLAQVGRASEERSWNLPGRNIPARDDRSAESSRTLGLETEAVSSEPADLRVNKPQKRAKGEDFTWQVTSSPAIEKAGTSAAKQEPAMPAKLSSNLNDGALPKLGGSRVGESSAAVGLHELAIPAALVSAESFMPAIISEAAPVLPAEVNGRVERLQELMAKEVRFFRQSGAQILEMVLEPAPATRVELHLELQQGCVEAVLSCDANNRAWLESHWMELQSSLADQGVVLRSLEAGADKGSRGQLDMQFGSRQEGRSQGSQFFEQPETMSGSSDRMRSPLVPTARRAGSDVRQLLEYWA